MSFRVPRRIALCLVLLAWPASAGAQDTGIDVDDGVLTVEAAYPGTIDVTSGPGVPYDGPRLRCGYFAVEVGGHQVIDFVAADPIIGETYLWSCWEPGRHPYLEPYDPTYPIVVVHDPTAAQPGPAITTQTVAAFAVERITFEAPVIATAPATHHVVGVPTWLAVTSQLDYDAVSAQAGPVWATVRPVFRDVTWNLGNGDRHVCVGDATNVWRADRGERQATECAYAFESADGGPFPGSATTTWTIWQQTDRNPTGWQIWGEVTLTTDVTFAVTDLQAAID
ncbi:MAG: hypothetical protein DHS20C19_11250 [Acidimicrobiales bacterium]|nr:MAG: hypothetical protein DHS20C19_11250 [Acidimicrobiales bacterium]